VTINFSRKAGENDQLFGSVTAADITEALAAQGFEIDKRRIQLAEPIKVVGQYEVTARLIHDVSATLKVHVTPEG
jgi:large subunit ribosomal protein L9